jgi:hypothetical protein
MDVVGAKRIDGNEENAGFRFRLRGALRLNAVVGQKEEKKGQDVSNSHFSRA